MQSDSSSPQGIQKQAPTIPACAREMKTTSGARHLGIMVPATESEHYMQAKPVATWQRDAQQCVEDGVEAEKMLDSAPDSYRGYESPARPFSPSHTVRHDQTVVHQPHDSQHEKHEAVPSERSYYGGMTEATDLDALVGGPVYAQDAVQDAVIRGDYGDDYHEGFEEEDVAYTMERLKDRVVLLQRQNVRLMEELARIVGLDMEDDDLGCEDVLRASARARCAAD